jgi:lysozyme
VAKRLLLSIFFVAGGLSLIAFLFSTGRLRLNYPSKEEFPFVGTDISHHQGKIDWAKLRSEDISFVIIKATEGGDFKDPLFLANWSESKNEGYKTGAYHFYRFCKDGKEQAKNFIESVPIDPDNLPPAIDLEFGGNCKTDKSREQILEEINEFLDILQARYEMRPMIYATNEFFDQFLIGKFKDNPIWIRDIYKRPMLSDGRSWAVWQFANRGHLNGIDGYVDLNVLNGNSFGFMTGSAGDSSTSK